MYALAIIVILVGGIWFLIARSKKRLAANPKGWQIPAAILGGGGALLILGIVCSVVRLPLQDREADGVRDSVILTEEQNGETPSELEESSTQEDSLRFLEWCRERPNVENVRFVTNFADIEVWIYSNSYTKLESSGEMRVFAADVATQYATNTGHFKTTLGIRIHDASDRENRFEFFLVALREGVAGTYE